MWRLAVVIPTYNESENLVSLIESLEHVLKNVEMESSVVIVDDASPDGTGEIAEGLAEEYRNIVVLHRSSKMGLGSAYKDGFTYALQKLNVDIILQMDADSSHDPKYIHDMVKALSEGRDVVIGSRRVSGNAIIGWNYYRKLISSIGNSVARTMCGLSTKDVTSGYRAFRSHCLRKMNINTIKSQGYAFQVEMLCRLERLKYNICEIPITFVDRKEGKSKLNSKEMLGFLATCVRIMLERQ
ncbi:MAG: polyprenol monophosphomannose synthase [Nitrososphaerales archaeon]